MKAAGKDYLKILIVAYSDMGHFTPLVHLSEEMERRGHEVFILTTSYGLEKCKKFA